MKKIKLFVIYLLLLAINYVAKSQTEVVISGIVTDSVTQKPIEKVIITNENEKIKVYSDTNGKYNLKIVVSEPFKMFFKKEGYITYNRIIEPANKRVVDVKLLKEVYKKGVKIDTIIPGRIISGSIIDISPLDYQNYKIIIYVLTDKWYIRPWADNREGRGYARIQDDGIWRIETLYRGYQAYLVAALLVESSYIPPSAVEVYSDDQEAELLSKIRVIASYIIEAPEGI
ncbi:MAG: hypothetical protein A2475_01265 [Ignavibacteria bacterium RIFOXYC2_FULL_35_21]|nr:MAG: hypothetical protein A2220_01780 [Ignavibacteria bacterium RIFOXYA2_FULL_35_10]OGV21273.1 MAG: hypothetical protein A2475_01265 [Ignavibacteria bacterium RIFOXYC2_FULL_35_21]